MATNYDKFKYDLLQANSLDDYFTHLDAGKNLLPIGGIQLDNLPAVKIGTPEAKDVREILGDLPVMLRNIKNSYLTVALMQSGIAYDNTSINNLLLIKLDITDWFDLLYSTAKREDLVISISEIANVRDKIAELNAKLTNYENKTTNDALRDADEQLNHANNSTELTSEALAKLEHDNLVDHLGKARPQKDEQAKDDETAGNDQASSSNNGDVSSNDQASASNNDDVSGNDQASASNNDETSGSDQASASNNDETASNDQASALNNVAPSDDNKPTADTSAENQANNEQDENSRDATANSDTKNPDDSNELDDLDLPKLDQATESDNEHQVNSQNTESTNNANSVKNNNVSSELDNLEKENLSHNVTNRPLSADAQTEMAKPDDKLQQVKSAAAELREKIRAKANAKANINPESQTNVPSVKMQTPLVQVTKSTEQDTQTKLLTKMMETLNLVLKRETKKDEEKQEPKAVSELTPKERLAKFRSNQDQLIASMIATQI